MWASALHLPGRFAGKSKRKLSLCFGFGQPSSVTASPCHLPPGEGFGRRESYGLRRAYSRYEAIISLNSSCADGGVYVMAFAPARIVSRMDSFVLPPEAIIGTDGNCARI